MLTHQPTELPTDISGYRVAFQFLDVTKNARHDKEIAKEIELMGIHVNSESMTMQRIIFSVLDDEI